MRYVYSERRLGAALGVTREDMRSVRLGMLAAEDWNGEHGEVAYTAEGVRKALRHFGVRAKGIPFTLQEVVVEGQFPADQKVEIVVTGRPLNKTIVMGTLEGKEVRVRVHNNQNFVPGMILSARNVEDDLYELVGREPRYRGVW